MLQKEKIIDLKNVSIFHNEHPILRNIDFELVEAEFCYVVGKSGSGKSTLLKSLYAQVPISEGSAFVLGTDLSKLKEKEIPALRRKLGMVFQDFQLFENSTVNDNLSFVLRATEWKDSLAIQNRIMEVLHKVNLEHKLNATVYTLSGGEKQRVAIARALLNSPKLLIADEPTGSLDAHTSDQILYLISDLAAENKMSVLFATHDQRILDKFPARRFACDQGSLVELL